MKVFTRPAAHAASSVLTLVQPPRSAFHTRQFTIESDPHSKARAREVEMRTAADEVRSLPKAPQDVPGQAQDDDAKAKAALAVVAAASAAALGFDGIPPAFRDMGSP